MLKSVVTRFRAYQLGTPGSSFSYFVDDHFTLIEGRLTDVNRSSLCEEMEICRVKFINVLHITSWDSDHCSANELLELLNLTRPLKVECPGYIPHTVNGTKCRCIIENYIRENQNNNRKTEKIYITPEYISKLDRAADLAFKDIIHNPLHLDSTNANNNSTAKHFRRGSFNLLSLGDIECQNISARLRRDKILGRETDVIILAHHGADNGFTNRRFIQHLEPKLAICTSDHGNQYGHPTQGIKSLLNSCRVELLTTKTGDVVVKSIGDHTGNYQAINLISGSTQVSSTYNFVSKKKHLLSLNDDSLRNTYKSVPYWRRRNY